MQTMIPQGLVWKFRSWERKFHRTILEKDELFFSSFSDNHNVDSQEGRVEYDLDFSPDQLKQLIAQKLITAIPDSEFYERHSTDEILKMSEHVFKP
ncbi:MAG: hypothetical protein ACK52I_26375, partial [Pseudomonadota bacterium]